MQTDEEIIIEILDSKLPSFLEKKFESYLVDRIDVMDIVFQIFIRECQRKNITNYNNKM